MHYIEYQNISAILRSDYLKSQPIAWENAKKAISKALNG